MGLTRFPHGVSSFGIPQVGSGAMIPTTTGTYFFVDSTTGISGNTGLAPTDALATVNQAIDKCTANKGDVIVAMPGHTETLSAAAKMIFDVAGITLVGLGMGGLRPTITHGAAAADVDVTGDNTTIRNIRFIAGFADVAESIDLEADDCWLDGCEWADSGSDLNYVDYIKLGGDNTCDGLKITNSIAIGADAANDGFVNCVGDVDRFIFQGNYIALNVATTEPVIEVTGKSLTNALVIDNYIVRANLSGIVFVDSDQTSNSGIFAYNLIASGDAGAATPFDVTGASCFENYQMGDVAADASGLLLPAVDDNA